MAALSLATTGMVASVAGRMGSLWDPLRRGAMQAHVWIEV
jgi:hypothetical protein